jgi:hypothetical protein
MLIKQYKVKEEIMKRFFSVALISFCLIGLLFFNSCKTEEEIVYDIRGSWTLNYFWSASDVPPPPTAMITFTGSLTSGAFVSDDGYNGTYTVNAMAVQWVYSMGTTYTGNFTTLTAMNGTSLGHYGGTGTWNATLNIAEI